MMSVSNYEDSGVGLSVDRGVDCSSSIASDFGPPLSPREPGVVVAEAEVYGSPDKNYRTVPVHQKSSSMPVYSSATLPGRASADLCDLTVTSDPMTRDGIMTSDPLTRDPTLLTSYKEIASEIDLTEDMERRFEEELAALRLRRSYLQKVQERTGAILSATVAENKSMTLPNKSEKSVPPFAALEPRPHSQSLASSPAPASSHAPSTPSSLLPPGFDGSSVPLKPVAAQFVTRADLGDPFSPPEKMPGFLLPHAERPSGFTEGQLISLSVSSDGSTAESGSEIDSQKMMEELKSAFESQQKMDEEKKSHHEDDLGLDDSGNTPSLMEKFLNSQAEAVSGGSAGTDYECMRNLASSRRTLTDSPTGCVSETSGEYKLDDNPHVDGSGLIISQYRGKNEMGEEEELLTVEAELPCDYPSAVTFPGSSGGFGFKPRLDPVCDEEAEEEEEEDDRKAEHAQPKGSASGAASPHFSAVDYKISESDTVARQEVEALKEELARLRERLEKLSNSQKPDAMPPHSGGADSYSRKLRNLQTQIQTLENFSTQLKPAAAADGRSPKSRDSQPGDQVKNVERKSDSPSQKSPQKTSLSQVHEEMKGRIVEEINELRQLNLKLLKEKFETDAIAANPAMMEKILLMAEEVELFQKRVIALEEKLSNVHLWLVEVETEGTGVGSREWKQLESEARLLLLEAAHERQTAQVSAMRRRSCKMRKPKRSASFGGGDSATDLAGGTIEVKPGEAAIAREHASSLRRKNRSGEHRRGGSFRRKAGSNHSYSSHQLGPKTDESPVWERRKESPPSTTKSQTDELRTGSIKTFPRRHKHSRSKTNDIRTNTNLPFALDLQPASNGKNAEYTTDSDAETQNDHQPVVRRRSSGPKDNSEDQSRKKHPNHPPFIREQESLQSDFIPVGETASPRSSTSSLVTSSEATVSLATGNKTTTSHSRQKAHKESNQDGNKSTNANEGTLKPPTSVFSSTSTIPQAVSTAPNTDDDILETPRPTKIPQSYPSSVAPDSDEPCYPRRREAPRNDDTQKRKSTGSIRRMPNTSSAFAESQMIENRIEYIRNSVYEKHPERVKQQRAGLIVVEQPVSQSKSHHNLDEADPWKASPHPHRKPMKSNTMPKSAFQSPNSFNQAASRESLLSHSKSEFAGSESSPFVNTGHHTPLSAQDPRTTPIYVDGGNLITTKAGIYRLRMPVSDLEGNDRRSQTRAQPVSSAALASTMQPHILDSDDFEFIDPGSKSDSELLPSMKKVKFSECPPQVSKIPVKRKKTLKNRFQKFTKELENHLKSSNPELQREVNGSGENVFKFDEPLIVGTNQRFQEPKQSSRPNSDSERMTQRYQHQNIRENTSAGTYPATPVASHSSTPTQARPTTPQNPGASPEPLETSFTGKQPTTASQPTARLSAVPCYYRTLPDNKIQVMYPESNQVFQFSYSKTLPPVSKKSSMQLIQQVQPDGKLSEEKLYFFDPVQLDENDTRNRYHDQMAAKNKQERSWTKGLGPDQVEAQEVTTGCGAESLFSSPGRRSGKLTPWFSKKKSAMRVIMRQTKDFIK